MDHQDTVQVTDQVHVSITRGAGNPDIVQVRVLKDTGIIKNGLFHPRDAIAQISRESAQMFVLSGDVEIVG